MKENTFSLPHFKTFLHPGMVLAYAPGRINLIGDHTDYNQGYALPAAINNGVYVGIKKRTDTAIHLLSVGFNEHFTIDINDLKPKNNSWINYPLGVIHQLLQNKYPIGGLNVVIDGNVPVGAGLSSSAAVECATIFAINHLFELGISALEMARLCQQAEHQFAGVNCGIMDMYASLFGKKEMAMLLDCKTLISQYQPVVLGNHCLMLVDTKVKHQLADTQYNLRRQQCDDGIAMIQKKYPQVETLRDATLAMINETIHKSEVVYKRCRYVIEENKRVWQSSLYLQKGDLIGLGKMMFQSHLGLRDDYEVSCPELDYLVTAAANTKAVLGSRMMGGGFGGCTINLIKKEAVEHFINQTNTGYQTAFGKEMVAIPISIENGAEIVTV